MAVAVNTLLLMPILLPFLLGIVIFGFRKWLRSFAGEIAVGGVIAVVAIIAAIANQITTSTSKIIYGIFDTSVGIEYGPPTGVQFRADGISIWVLLLLNIIMILVLIHESPNIREQQNAPIYVSFLLILITGINTAFLAFDFFTLFLAWSVIGLSLILLITFNRKKEDLKNGGIKAYITIGFAISMLLLAVVLTYGLFGTLNFGYILENNLFTESLLQSANLLIYFIIALVILSLGIFANFFLLNVWIPSTIESARVGVKVMTTAFTSATALFSLMNILSNVFAPEIFSGNNYSFILAGIGLITAFEGLLLIISQLVKKEDINLMKITIYTIFVNIGITLTSLSFRGILIGELVDVVLLQDCLGYGYLYLINSVATTFLSIICVEKFAKVIGGEYDLTKLKGLGKELPLSGFIYTISLLSNVGILPTFGGITVFMIIKALFRTEYLFFAIATTIIILVLLICHLLVIKNIILNRSQRISATASGVQADLSVSTVIGILLAISLLLFGFVPSFIAKELIGNVSTVLSL